MNSSVAAKNSRICYIYVHVCYSSGSSTRTSRQRYLLYVNRQDFIVVQRQADKTIMTTLRCLVVPFFHRYYIRTRCHYSSRT